MQFLPPRCLRLLPLLCGLAAPAFAEAPAACRYVPFATLPIRAFGNGQLTVDGAIDGKPAILWLSLGNIDSKLMFPAVGKYGLRMDNTGKYIFGIGGASVKYAAIVDDFSVGPAHSGRVATPVVGTTAMAPTFDAIAGSDFLLQADLEISLADKELRFFQPSDCKDTFLAYWDKEAMEIPFGGTVGKKSTNPHFIVELNGVKMEAVIATAMPRTTVSRKAAERAGIAVGAPGVVKAPKATGIGAEKVERWTAEFASLAIGSETIQNATLD
ncbi:MAG TPA: hypothetical protein VFG03_17950, partial [Telluria sp.]|nr:hypothetical protein [Telluria sp.]